MHRKVPRCNLLRGSFNLIFKLIAEMGNKVSRSIDRLGMRRSPSAQETRQGREIRAHATESQIEAGRRHGEPAQHQGNHDDVPEGKRRVIVAGAQQRGDIS
jgi:hypothetical protein